LPNPFPAFPCELADVDLSLQIRNALARGVRSEMPTNRACPGTVGYGMIRQHTRETSTIGAEDSLGFGQSKFVEQSLAAVWDVSVEVNEFQH
jgi:hypothetical protein